MLTEAADCRQTGFEYRKRPFEQNQLGSVAHKRDPAVLPARSTIAARAGLIFCVNACLISGFDFRFHFYFRTVRQEWESCQMAVLPVRQTAMTDRTTCHIQKTQMGLQDQVQLPAKVR